jgi:TolB-like protein
MTKAYSFGPYRLDAALGVLSRDDQPTSLGSRAAALLQRLLEQAGQPVGKEDLMAAAWPGLVVEESNLTVQIAALRKVLGEAGSAAWIKTLPRRGYRYVGPQVRLAPTAVQVDESSPPLPSRRPSVAVLPFANIDSDPQQAYFADGMVEDIVSGLSRVRWMFVIARSSTLKYRQQPSIDTEQVGLELGVRYVLQGSVRKASGRIRITCQLVETASGVQVWSERYDRALKDVFELQDEVAIAVLGAIEPTLRQAEARRVKRKRPDSLDAYEMVLQAQADVFSGMPESSHRALGMLNRALAIEPDYALAHSYAAMCHHNLFLRDGLNDADRAASIGHARAAMANGQDDALALTFSGFSMGMDAHDREAAFAAFATAIAISPSSALTYILGSVLCGWSGQAERAIEWAEKGLRPGTRSRWGISNLAASTWLLTLRLGRSRRTPPTASRMSCKRRPWQAWAGSIRPENPPKLP